MINAAIVGLGWWGKTLVESVQGTSKDIQFLACATRTASDDTKAFCEAQKLQVTNFDAVLADARDNATFAEPDEFAGLHIEVHSAHRLHDTRRGGELHLEVTDRENRAHALPPPCLGSNASRRPSPMNETQSVMMRSAANGYRASHQ